MACVYLLMLPWEVFLVNLVATICGDRRIKGFREKGEWNRDKY